MQIHMEIKLFKSSQEFLNFTLIHLNLNGLTLIIKVIRLKISQAYFSLVIQKSNTSMDQLRLSISLRKISQQALT